MASVLLSAAGSAIGTSVGGSVLGIGAASIGQAVGAVAGSFVDQSLFGTGRQPTDVGRAQNLRLLTSTEGASIPLIFGAIRVAGQLIWSTRFKENITNSNQGGKATGGKSVREFSYTISFAIGLGIGVIDKVGRVWADGQLMSLENLNYRLYRGDELQLPDPKIEAVEGQGLVPSYRGLAYIVFEDFEIGSFGNRIPQLNFEVFRSPNIERSPELLEERGVPLRENINAVTLSPGTGDFSLHPTPVYYIKAGQPNRYANVNNTSGDSDFIHSIDQLQKDLPNCKYVSLIVSWFGTDLRAGYCKVLPKIEERGRRSAPYEWTVSGLNTNNAELVSRDADGRPNFGGSPSDSSIIHAIKEINSRGLSVMLYPFLLMDIPENNNLPNPYKFDEYQPKFPWRGRITLAKAPGQIGSSDLTDFAEEEVKHFFGSAKAEDFTEAGEQSSFSGNQEWSWSRFVLHLANIAKIAGGVNSICVGSEMRGLTTVRKSKSSFPAVECLITLSAEVKKILPDAMVSYAADWSEYFGYHPIDGSNDVIFHLDDLWSNPNIDFIGIDDYTPLSDWRDTFGHIDAKFEKGSIYSLSYLKNNIEGGEYYDYYYDTDVDRNNQNRKQVYDSSFGEHWVFRPKDFKSWWSSNHFNRIDGIKSRISTPWLPESKPIIFTECGCPAVKNGSNQPNVFFDGKSSESKLPYFSDGSRDDEIQRRFLQSKIEYWKDTNNNPISKIYNNSMIASEKIFIWTWDARPWPDFPARESVWADCPSHHTGHWITGRISSVSLQDTLIEIGSVLDPHIFEISNVSGTVYGYSSTEAVTIAELMSPLLDSSAIEIFESGGRIKFNSDIFLTIAGLFEPRVFKIEDKNFFDFQKNLLIADDRGLKMTFISYEGDYQIQKVENKFPENINKSIDEINSNSVFPINAAEIILLNKINKKKAKLNNLKISLKYSDFDLEPADLIILKEKNQIIEYKIHSILRGKSVEILAYNNSIEKKQNILSISKNNLERRVIVPSGEFKVEILELSISSGKSDDYKPWLAVYADPWIGPISVMLEGEFGRLEYLNHILKRSQIGYVVNDVNVGSSHLVDRSDIIISITNANIFSISDNEFYNGKNKLAIQVENNEWRIIYFQFVLMLGPDLYKISNLRWGVMGSQIQCGVKIKANSIIVILDDSVVQLNISRDVLGENIKILINHEKSVGSKKTAITINKAVKSKSEEPIAPCHLKIVYDNKLKNYHISWIRSSRIRAEDWGPVEIALGEEKELYKIEIFRENNLIREIYTNIESAQYDYKQQLDDDNFNNFLVKVSQFSNETGFGQKAEVRYGL